MTRIHHSIVFVLLLSFSVAAQDGYYWALSAPFGSGSGNGTASTLLLLDASGAVRSLPYSGLPNFPSVGMVVKRPSPFGVWVTTAGAIVSYSPSGPGTPVLAPQVLAMCADIAGDLWTFSGSAAGPGVLEHRDTSGAVLQTFPLQTIIAQDMLGDPFGNIWVLDSMGGLEKVSPSGVITGPVPLPPGDLEIDHLGNLWLLTGWGQWASLLKLDTNATVVLSLPVPGAMALAIDGHGHARVVVSTVTGNHVSVVDGAGTVLQSSLLLPGAFYFGVTVDGGGQSWLSYSTGGRQYLEVRSSSGHLLNTFETGPWTVVALGDPTGSHVTSVLARNADADGDGVPNGVEHQVGTHAQDASSAPPRLTLAGMPMAGQTITVTMNVPSEAGLPYVIGASLGTTGISTGPSAFREIPLTEDWFYDFWLSPANTMATNSTGVVDPSGQATTTITFPIGDYSGFSFFMSGVTVDPTRLDVLAITAPLPITIQ